MKKISAAVFVFAATIVLSGCGFQKEDPKQAPAPAVKESPVEPKSEDNGIIGSIKDAIGLGSNLKCVSTSKEGEVAEVFVQGKKFKATSTIEKKKQNIVNDGTAMFIWAEGEKTGIKMVLSCLEDLKTGLPEQQKNLLDNAVPDIEKELSSSDEKVNCVKTGAIDFAVPTEVVFTDQCALMKKSVESMKNVKLPAGVKVPTDLPAIPN